LLGTVEGGFDSGSASFLLHEPTGSPLPQPGLCGPCAKKQDPQCISDFRPISLTHSFAKIISKMLANRLGLELNKLISINQTTFIRKRCIHDNFMHVQQVVKDLHKRKIPSLFIKLDISKAFDTVNWPYLMSIMTYLGFGRRWSNWISSLWCTSSSCYLLNGQPEKRVLHCRGVRQGDPLPPMLFLLAIEPLHRLFRKAQQTDLLQHLSNGCEYLFMQTMQLYSSSQLLQTFKLQTASSVSFHRLVV
jgi:hypothetical protein